MTDYLGYYDNERVGQADVDALVASTNDAAKNGATLTIGFVATIAYLFVSAAGTTDETLLLDGNVTFPILNAGISCRLFYVLAPVLLVGLHIHLLLQEYLLAARIRTLLGIRRPGASAPPAPVINRNREAEQFFPSVAAALALAWGSPWYVKPVVRSLFVSTNIVMPLLLLLFMQGRFLPYHYGPISYLHRGLVTLDVVFSGFFFFSSPIRSERAMGYGPRNVVYGIVFLAGGLAAVILSWWVIDVPASRAAASASWGGRALVRFSWFTHPFIELPHRAMASEPNHAHPEHPEGSRDGRDLSGANFNGASLAGFNFEGADLTGANFDGATLTEARFGRGPSGIAVDDPGDACDLQRHGAAGRTRLDGASFVQANLQDADLRAAVLSGARLNGAVLTRARFDGATADSADLTDATGAGASFNDACLRGARLRRAKLQVASFKSAHLEVSSLLDAHLELSDFHRALLWGADLRRAFLRGARNLSPDSVDLRWARLEAVDLCGSAEERGGSKAYSGRGARQDEPTAEEPVGDFARLAGFGEPLYVDLRGASFAPATGREWTEIGLLARKALPAGGKVLEQLLEVTQSASERRALSCVDSPGGRASGEPLTLLFHAAQLASPAMQRLRQRGKPLDEDDFYRGIAQQLANSSIQSKPVPGVLPPQVQRELAPFVARSVVKPRLGAEVASKYDRAVACWLINENDRLTLPPDLEQSLHDIAGDCEQWLKRAAPPPDKTTRRPSDGRKQPRGVTLTRRQGMKSRLPVMGLAPAASGASAAAVARGRCDGGRHRPCDDGGDTAGRGDLAVAVEHLPARARLAVDAPQRPAGDAGALRRRFRGHQPHAIGVRAGRSAGPGDPGPAWARATSGQDEAGRALRRQGGLRLPRLPPAQAHERSALGGDGAQALFPPPLAVAACDAAYPAARQGVDSPRAVPRRSARGDRRAEPAAAGKGQLLSHR
jgi:uncharacterized protein YjbI with pentapeptide repeats